MTKLNRNSALLSLIFLLAVSGIMFSCSENAVNHHSVTITAVQPDSGYVGDKVIIKGRGFVPQKTGNIVYFNNTRAKILDVRAGVITTEVPAGATTGPIEVEVDGKRAVGPTFTVLSNQGQLAINGIHPTSGPTGTHVTVIGTGFSSVMSQNTIRFNGTLAQVVEVYAHKTVSDDSAADVKKVATAVTAADSSGTSSGMTLDSLVAIVPQKATTGPVQLTVNEQTVTGPTFTVITGPPSISKIDPSSGKTCTTVTITGKNFSATKGDNTVRFGSKVATVQSATATKLVVTVPGGLSKGTVKVTVKVGEQTSASSDFTVTGDGCSADTPTVSDMTPTSGPVGTKVTLKGTNLKGGTVKIGGKDATVTSSTDTEIIFEIPSGLTPGNSYSVTVTNNNHTVTAPKKFTVTAPKPKITKIDPTSGKTCSTATITGTNFSATKGDNTVKFGSTVATVQSATTTKLVVTIPSGLSKGTVKVTVTVGGQESASVDFEVTGDGCGTDVPTISNIDPTSGPTGTTVTLTGTNFSKTTSDNTVNFGSTEATITSASATKLVVTVPKGLAVGNSYTVTVTTNKQTATAPDKFTVTAQPPTVTKVDPTSGKTCSTVTIEGTNFTKSATVQFNTTDAANVTFVSDTKLTVKVPSGLAKGTYDVTVTVGTQTSNAGSFEVTGDGCTTPPTNKAPTAEFTYTATGLSVQFDASSSVDSDGSIKSYKWDFGDSKTGTGSKPKHTYGKDGTYTVKLTVTDDKGATDTVSQKVTVKTGTTNQAPTAKFTSTVDGLKAQLDGSGSSDPDGSIKTYKWDFGDGNSASGGAKQDHTYAKSGTYTVKLTVTDDKGATNSVSHDVTVTASTKPHIDNIDPIGGETCSVVTLTGTNFSATKTDNIVNFGTTQATVKTATANKLEVKVPKGLTINHKYDVTVTVNGQTATASQQYDVTGNGCVPTITNFTPTSGPVGETVTINGTNFSGTPDENTVKFNGTTVTDIKSASPLKLVVVVPSGATTGKITVTVNGETATSKDDFTVLTTIKPDDPIVGSTASIEFGETGGACLGCGISNEQNVIDGNVDTNYGLVTVGASLAGGYYVQVNSLTEIPAGGDAGFVVAREGQLVDTKLLSSITITTYDKNGTELESSSGSDVLNLHLLSDNSDKTFVSFNTEQPFYSIRITFMSLVGAATKYDVYAAYGGMPAASYAGPTISSLSTYVGPVGTEVTITGTNFSTTKGDNTVTFDGTPVSGSDFVSASETELVVKVPSGATSGPVAVEVGEKTATAAKDFTVGTLPLTGNDLTVTMGKTGLCAGCSAKDGDNIKNADPDDYAQLKAIVAALGASVYLDVQSTQTYSAGGQAGFTITKGSGLLGLSLLDGITVTTYLDGTEQESATGNGGPGGLLGLKLLRNGQTDRRFVGFKTTKDFDEIKVELSGAVIVDKTFQVYSVFDNFSVTK